MSVYSVNMQNILVLSSSVLSLYCVGNDQSEFQEGQHPRTHFNRWFWGPGLLTGILAHKQMACKDFFVRTLYLALVAILLG